MSYKIRFSIFDADDNICNSCNSYKIQHDDYIYGNATTKRDELVAEIYHDLDMFATGMKMDYSWIEKDEGKLESLGKSISIKGAALSLMRPGHHVIFYISRDYDSN